MSDDQYHIMRMNGMSPSGLPLPEEPGESELSSSTGSDAVVRFRIKLCCDYGPNHRGWGEWHEHQVGNKQLYDGLLKKLIGDRTIVAFEVERQNAGDKV